MTEASIPVLKLEPTVVFHDFLYRDPVHLDELSEAQGIYALHDHNGSIRYIGIKRPR
jgi:hypothetical protein